MSLIAFVNGSFLPLDQATVHVEDRGFQFADSVYEVIACYGGHSLDLMPHLKRLQRSCHEIRIDLPYSLDELQRLIEELYSRNSIRNAMVYMQVTRGVAPRSHANFKTDHPTLVMTLRELPAPSAHDETVGVKAITLRDFRWGRCDIKSTAMLASVMGKQLASAAAVDEAIWLDAEDHILEGCSTNIFGCIDGRLVTQPLGHRILGGIMRDMVMAKAAAIGLETDERPWKLSETGLSECMMSSTTNALLPVTVVDDHPIGDGRPGPVSRQIRRLILEDLERLRGA